MIWRELTFSRCDAEALARQVRQIDRDLLIQRVRYTVADPSLFMPQPTKHSGLKGQYIADGLAYYGLPVVAADADEVNGWHRVHALLRPSPDVTPWLTIDPGCLTVIAALSRAQSDLHDPDLMAAAPPALIAVRYGAMSQPRAPRHHRAAAYPAGSPGWLMQRERQQERRAS